MGDAGKCNISCMGGGTGWGSIPHMFEIWYERV